MKIPTILIAVLCGFFASCTQEVYEVTVPGKPKVKKVTPKPAPQPWEPSSSTRF